MKCFSFYSLSGEINVSPGDILPESEYRIALEAVEVLEKVKEDAIVYRREMSEVIEQEKQQAIEKGTQQGLEAFNAHILAVDQEKQRIEELFHAQILPLAITAAKRIVGEELKLHPDRIKDIVRAALKSVAQHRKIVIYVNRMDREHLEQHKPELRKIFEHLESLVVQERDDIEPGGCIIETEAGIINAQLANQWRALETALASFTK